MIGLRASSVRATAAVRVEAGRPRVERGRTCNDEAGRDLNGLDDGPCTMNHAGRLFVPSVGPRRLKASKYVLTASSADRYDVAIIALWLLI